MEVLMSKAIIVGVAILSVAVGAWAGDPWKSKPYQQWDEKEVQRIMFDSPWAQVVTVDANWRGSGQPQEPVAPSQAPQGQSGGYGGGGMAGRSSGGGMGGNQSQPGENEGMQAIQGPQARFLVRWVSARVIREATVRDAVLSGKMQEADAQKALAEPVTEYQVLVAGPDMGPFTGVDEKTLAADAYLKAKKSKEKIAASRVEIQHDSSSQKVVAVLFAFPKKGANGEATIGTGEKGVEFECHVQKLSLKASFDPQKMVDQQGTDL
jgi:hypothetical protein